MLPSCRAVILIAFPVHDRGRRREVGRRIGYDRHQAYGLAASLPAALFTGILEPLASFLIRNRTRKTFPAAFADIERADGRNRPHTMFVLGVVQRVAAADANAQRADPQRIDLGMLSEEVDSATDVVHALPWHLHEARFAAAFTLVGRIISQTNKARLGETLGIEAGGLFFDGAEWMGHHDRSILPAAVEVRGFEQVGDDVRPHVPRWVSDAFNRHAFLIGIVDHCRPLHSGGLSRCRSDAKQRRAGHDAQTEQTQRFRGTGVSSHRRFYLPSHISLFEEVRTATCHQPRHINEMHFHASADVQGLATIQRRPDPNLVQLGHRD